MPSASIADRMPSARSGWLREASVSSMRSTNVPPVCLATAQLNSAERAPPTWNMPVGDGAKRTRTSELPAAGVTGTAQLATTRRIARGRRTRRRSDLAPHHGVGEHPDALDLALHAVPGLDRADTGRGAGEQHVARQQRHRLRGVGHQILDVEDHLRGTAVLLRRTVDARAD